MGKMKSIEVRCLHCGTWFPSPIAFDQQEGFDGARMFENQAQCPNCNKMTGCNKENMRTRSDDGGFKGKDT